MSSACETRIGHPARRVGSVVRAAALAAAMLVGPAIAAAAQQSPPPRALPESFAELADRLVPAVVNVSTTQAISDRNGPELPQMPPGSPFEDWFHDFFGERGDRGGQGGGAKPRVQSLGSGFVVDPSGLIVTNNHVVADAEEITVTLTDESSLKARVVGRDPVTDLALLKVDAKQPLPAVGWGDSSKTRVGDWVLAIGNPFGLGGTVTAGIVSARARDIHAGPYDDFLQTDAAINRGNSGGPMLNLAGEVIGINTAIFSPSGGSVGVGFAIPSALAKPIIDQLRTAGKVERGWIGVRIQSVTDEIADNLGLDKPHGALVSDIDPGGPAARAKLQPGDVILSFDGKPIERTRQLPRMVAETPAEKSVKLTIWRDGKEMPVDVRVGSMNAEQVASAAPLEQDAKSPPTVDALGLSLAKVTPELRRDLDLPDDTKGVVVVDVDDDSAAAQRGVRPGDVIAAVGRDAVTTPEQVKEKVDGAKRAGRRTVLLRVQREGSAQFLALPLAE
ncbi:MAG TPA: DegQ family serine endoprotease [Stellaceae bacterium]